MQTATAEAGKFNAVNTERFFKEISHFFERPEGVLLEIAQNAHRAGATTLNIKIDKDKNTLTAEDNGHGADSVAPMFCLADSAWSKEVEEGQMPAGWGLFYLMAISERVAYQSAFGYVEVDCNRFLGVHEYREGLFGLIKPNEKIGNGFRLVASLKEGIAKQIDSDAYFYEWRSLGYFPLDITVNGKRVGKRSLAKKVSEGHTALEWKPGCTVYIPPNCSGLFIDRKLNTAKTTVVFHGIPINMPFSEFEKMVFVDITEGCPLTPVLPYRTTIKVNGQTESLSEYVRKHVVERTLQEIAANANNSEVVLNAFFVAEETFTQEELDNLDRWFAMRTDDNDTYWNDSEYILVKKGEIPMNQETVLTVNGAPVEEYFVIEDGLAGHIQKPARSPEWMKVDSERVVVDVRYTKGQGRSDGLNYRWQKADSITVGGKPVRILCTIDVNDDIDTIYYTVSPKGFWSIDNTVFKYYIYREEGVDGYEAQEDLFRNEIGQDIQKLTGIFERSDILKGLWTASISPYNVQSLSMEMDTIRVTLKDGTERVLSLAA